MPPEQGALLQAAVFLPRLHDAQGSILQLTQGGPSSLSLALGH